MARIAHFRNRIDAGQQLARQLRDYARRPDVVVLALPRGGVPVGYAVAQALEAPLDILLVRKLGVPGHEEYAMGAIAGSDLQVLHADVIERLRIPPSAIESAIGREAKELERREQLYRANRPALPLEQHTVILVDDGLATGATMQVAVRAARQRQAARVVVAVPVGAEDACRKLEAEADQVICLDTPSPFHAVGIWYDDFAQTSDEEVRRLLAQAQRDARHGAGNASSSMTTSGRLMH
jgi:putative phosphoribosyl transferase